MSHLLLVDKVQQTSMEHVTGQMLDELCQIFVALCTDPVINESSQRTTPENWHRVIDKAQGHGARLATEKVTMTVHEFGRLYKSEKKGEHVTPTTSLHNVGDLSEFLQVAELIRAEKVQENSVEPGVKDLGTGAPEKDRNNKGREEIVASEKNNNELIFTIFGVQTVA